jgi:hypothetical protein
MELSNDVFLRHHDAANMGRGVQPTLIEFANLRILRHDQIGEIHDVAQVELRVAKVCGENRYSTRSSVCSGPKGNRRTTRT